ncbi:hypothetical protein BDA96_10G318300 [Sorghum bicolor]|uniref:Uncharacterized protein n=1 Tax=Sorghum bicolor TaxID=4558 RepID=A0A921Q6D6_SORBI|nr:hypothetical protein BDA96_10G318300 [Sorghum bicolor]
MGFRRYQPPPPVRSTLMVMADRTTFVSNHSLTRHQRHCMRLAVYRGQWSVDTPALAAPAACKYARTTRIQCHGREGRQSGDQAGQPPRPFSPGHGCKARATEPAAGRTFRESQTCAHVLGTCHGRISPRAGTSRRAARAGHGKQRCPCPCPCVPAHLQPAPHCKAASATVRDRSARRGKQRKKLHARFPPPGTRHPAPGTAGTPPQLASLGYHPFRGCRRGRGGRVRARRVGQVKAPRARAAPTGVDVRAGRQPPPPLDPGCGQPCRVPNLPAFTPRRETRHPASPPERRSRPPLARWFTTCCLPACLASWLPQCHG